MTKAVRVQKSSLAPILIAAPFSKRCDVQHLYVTHPSGDIYRNENNWRRRCRAVLFGALVYLITPRSSRSINKDKPRGVRSESTKTLKFTFETWLLAYCNWIKFRSRP